MREIDQAVVVVLLDDKKKKRNRNMSIALVAL